MGRVHIFCEGMKKTTKKKSKTKGKGVVAAAARSGCQWHLRRREQGRPVRRFAAKRNVSPGIAGRPRSVRRDVFFGRARYRELRVQSPGGRVVPTARRPVDEGIGIVTVRLRPERVVARRDKESSRSVLRKEGVSGFLDGRRAIRRGAVRRPLVEERR